MGMKSGTCDRCGARAVLTMSRFNTDMICVLDTTKEPCCEKKEQAHPQYAAAKAAEEEAVRRGDYNFPGIGKPADL